MSFEIDKKTAFIYAFMLAILVIGITTASRISTNPAFPGDQAYYHLSVIDNLNGKAGISTLHEKGFNVFSIYDGFLYLLSFALGKNIAFFMVPIFTGLLMMISLYLILSKLNMSPHTILISLSMFALSPAFIYSSFVVSPIPFYAALSMLALYFLMSEDIKIYSLSIALFFLISISSFFCASINIAILAGYLLSNESKRRRTIFALTIAAIGLIGYCSLVVYTYGIPEIPNFVSRNIIQDYFSDLGGLISFSTFSIILFFFGIYFLSEKKDKCAPFLVMIVAIFALSIFSNKANIYLNIFVSIIAGYALLRFMKMEWSSKLMKIIAIMTLVIGIIFSAITYGSLIINEMPTENMVKSLEFLSEYSNGEGIVLSHYTRGHIIRQISGNQVLMDSDLYYYHNISQTNRDMMIMFNSSELKTTKILLDKYNVSYIYIDPEMKAMIWEGPEDSLLYLFTNNETFNNIYRKNSIEIWKVNRR